MYFSYGLMVVILTEGILVDLVTLITISTLGKRTVHDTYILLSSIYVAIRLNDGR
jgi:hypothetical protein